MSGERNRVLKLLLVVAIAVSAVGFLTGVRKAVEPQGYVPPTVVESEGDVVEAPTQAELAARHGPNRTRHPAAFAAMARDHRGLEEHVEPASDEEWEAVVARRAGRRAFAGAPPTIPHDIDQQGRPSCEACHLALFADIELEAELLGVTLKAGPRDYTDEVGVTLERARELLLAGRVAGAQLRYRHDGHEWWDTVMVEPDGFLVVRIEQRFGVAERDPEAAP